jgi:hypothetical protein
MPWGWQKEWVERDENAKAGKIIHDGRNEESDDGGDRSVVGG